MLAGGRPLEGSTHGRLSAQVGWPCRRTAAMAPPELCLYEVCTGKVVALRRATVHRLRPFGWRLAGCNADSSVPDLPLLFRSTPGPTSPARLGAEAEGLVDHAAGAAARPVHLPPSASAIPAQHAAASSSGAKGLRAAGVRASSLAGWGLSRRQAARALKGERGTPAAEQWRHRLARDTAAVAAFCGCVSSAGPRKEALAAAVIDQAELPAGRHRPCRDCRFFGDGRGIAGQPFVADAAIASLSYVLSQPVNGFTTYGPVSPND